MHISEMTCWDLAWKVESVIWSNRENCPCLKGTGVSVLLDLKAEIHVGWDREKKKKVSS